LSGAAVVTIQLNDLNEATPRPIGPGPIPPPPPVPESEPVEEPVAKALDVTLPAQPETPRIQQETTRVVEIVRC